MSGYTQVTGHDFEHDRYIEAEFGPFDTWETVIEWLEEHIPPDGLAPAPLP